MASSWIISPALPILILSAIASHPLIAHAGGSFFANLIHRDSPESPFYNPTSTSYSRLIAAAHRSYNRASYLSKRVKHPSPMLSPASEIGDNDIHSEILMNEADYLLAFYIGSPARKILAIADTGSDLIWAQCSPCKDCFEQSAPLFDPAASSTYKIVPCDAVPCSAVTNRSCVPGDHCEYNYNYTDGSLVNGFLSTETLSLDSDAGDQVRFPEILFGCTHRSHGLFDKNDAGIIGLSGGNLSLIRQLGSTIAGKFSYCLPAYGKTAATSRFNFGTKAIINGSDSVSTPLITGFRNTHYFLILEKISVDGHGAVVVTPSMTALQPFSSGNIVIDSGTTLTFIDNETLRAVETMVASNVTLPRANDTSGIFRLCYNISTVKNDSANTVFPAVKFHFSGAVVVLPPINMFFAVTADTVCLGLLPTQENGVNLFGNVAQQNFHIGYDLDAMRLTFEPANCGKL